MTYRDRETPGMTSAPPGVPPPPAYYLPEQYFKWGREGSLPHTSTPNGTAPIDTGPAGSAPTGPMNGAGQTVGRVATILVAVVGFAAKLLPLGSLVLSAWLFGFAYGSWAFGIGIVSLLFVHEMGHFVTLKLKGMPARWPVFIPFLGAYVAMPQSPTSVAEMAVIALAGPLFGGAGAAVCLALYFQTGVPLWLTLAYFGFFLNLINLAPINPLDGGRVAGAISRWLWPVGILLALGYLFFVQFNVILLVIVAFGAYETFDAFFGQDDGRQRTYFRIPFASRVLVTISYVALALVLLAGMLSASSMLAQLRFP